MPLLEKIKQNKSLSKKDMQSFIVTLFDSNIETNVKVELLKAYTNKDMGQYELTYLVEYFIQTNYPDQPFYNKAMCVCGTGGDQSNSFNISTTVAFVVASAGVPVIKHGNKSITSHSGSTDVLHEMNIKTNKMYEVEQQLNSKGLAFISATDSYPMMKKLQSIRKSIATPTIFNLIGPLINPFKLTYQVMGVYEASQLENIAQTLKDLGRKRAILIHGANGMDEATLSGENIIYEINSESALKKYSLKAEEVGLAYAKNDTLIGGSPQKNKQIALNILSGNDHSSKRDVVLLNAGIALYVAEQVESIKHGVERAKYLIDTGMAMKQYLKMGG